MSAIHSPAHPIPDKGGKQLLQPQASWRELRTEDQMLMLVRAGMFVGAAAWTALAPEPSSVRVRCAFLLGIFLTYSVVILTLIYRWPHRGREIYLGALGADLVLLYFLFGETGGITSPFLPAAFLLSALTAFHYGPVLGVLAACAGLGLALLSDVSSVTLHHWSGFPLVLIFVTLTAAYVGWLARREAQERREIEHLHDELHERARDLEGAYRRCKEVQDHLVHSERLATIGRMSAEMAHQVRNPLSAISLNLELLEDEVSRLPNPSCGEAQNLITAILREIDNLADVTESYLRFAKLPPFRWEQVDLNEIVREIVVFARPQIEQRAIKVSRHVEEGVPPVRMDRRQFKFAVMNVLTNALEAMSAGGRLRISTQANNGTAEIIISDTGMGIPPKDMAKIFDPFFTTKQAGTGLGLGLVRRIIASHGGRIACKSIRQVGTTFTISLPIEHRRERAGRSRTSDEENSDDERTLCPRC